MAAKTGIAAVVARTTSPDALLPPAPEQPDLLGLRPIAPATPRPGRPPGAMNRRTADVAEFVLSQVRDPLLVLAKMAEMGVEEIQAALGCSRLEAWQEKRHAAAAALPYLHRRMPLAVDVTTRTPVYLTITDGEARVSVAEEAAFVDVVEYQQVSGGDDAPV